MNRLKITNTLLAITLLFVAFSSAFANEVEILATDFYKTGKNLWTINVTLRHEDTGWEHYADNWRVVDSKSNILGDRVLYHPHVNEQPFTRSLNNVMIPEDVTIVYIVAHDNVHGWSPDRLKVDLNLSVSGRLRIEENKN
jgi:hypothetical protein